jgi:xanthine/uracil/vitamin C permease (AzgA family)
MIVADFTTGAVSTTSPPTTYIDSASNLALGMRAYGQFIID